MKGIQLFASVLLALLVFYTSCQGIPISDSTSAEDIGKEDSSEDNDDRYEVQNLPQGFDLSGLNLSSLSSNDSSPKDLYVIKAIVYEIGILTDAEENDTSSDETHERVDLTFFDAHSNDSHIDLGNIPLPIQTNINGQVLTGIAPVEVGAFSNPSDLLRTLPLTGTIVNISHSDTAYFQLKRSNLSDDEEPHFLGSRDISKLFSVSDLLPLDKSSSRSEEIDDEKPVPITKNNSI